MPQLVSTTAVSCSPRLTVCFGASRSTCFGSGSLDQLAALGARLRGRLLVVAAAAPDQHRGDRRRPRSPRRPQARSGGCPSLALAVHRPRSLTSWDHRPIAAGGRQHQRQGAPPRPCAQQPRRPGAVGLAAGPGADAPLLLRARSRLGRAHRRRQRRAPRRRSRRRSLHVARPPERVLDIGCGTGEGDAIPRPRVPPGAGPRRRHLRGDDPPRRRPRSASTRRAGSPSRSATPPLSPIPTSPSTSSPSSTCRRSSTRSRACCGPGGHVDRRRELGRRHAVLHAAEAVALEARPARGRAGRGGERRRGHLLGRAARAAARRRRR